MNNQFTINSIDELPQAAQWVDAMIEQSNRRIILLDGAMGAGKTTLIGAYCKAKNVGNPISSPTFALVNNYYTPSGEPIYHFDFYRIDSEQEALDMGVFDYLDSGNLCFVEWPEKVSGILSQCDTLSITITATSPTSRSLTAHL